MLDQLSMPFLCLIIFNQKLKLATPYSFSYEKAQPGEGRHILPNASFLCGSG
jgi:hypothetical protein